MSAAPSGPRVHRGSWLRVRPERRLRRAAATFVLLSGLLGGCSDEAEPSAPPEPPPSDASEEPAVSSSTPSPRPTPGAADAPLEEFLAQAEQVEQSMNPIVGRIAAPMLAAQLDRGVVPDEERIRALMRLTNMLLVGGANKLARDRIEQAFEVLRERPDATILPELHLLRGVVHLRMAEVRNCVAKHNAECCIFPLEGGGVHAQKGPARAALADLLEFLKLAPRGDEAAQLRWDGVRWLANVVAMALDQHPDALPEALQIPPEAFASEGEAPRFADRATQLGVDRIDLCGGAIVQDFDLDGRLDLFSTTFDLRGPAGLSTRLPDGGFADRSDATGLDTQLGGLNAVAGDYDDDGDVDVLVLRGGWLHEEGQIRNSLLRNDGGRFVDVTHEAGLARPARPTQAAAWFDHDGDGDLDLYIGNESRRALPGGAGDYPSQLFQNEGDGRFVDIAASAGVTNDRYAKGVAAGDYDNDGDVDLYVSNSGPGEAGINRLYRNEGEGRFVDVAPELGLTAPEGRSFATWFFDYDNDGWLDLFVAGFDSRLGDVARSYLGRPHTGTPPCLYRNLGDGRFQDVARELGLDRPWLPMGANFCDVDNDGYLDLYLATGDPNYRTLVPNVLLRNDRARRFLDVTTAAGLGHLQKGHGVAFADLDHDGDQDLFHQLGGFYAGDRFHNALFENLGPADDATRAHWLVVSLRGRECNHFGFGARLCVRLRAPDGTRELHRAIGSVSSFGGSPFRCEIGLGDATAIEEIEVWWPGREQRQIVREVPLDSAILIEEGGESFQRLPYEPLPFPEN